MDCRPPGPLSMGFSRQEYWNRLPFLSPGDLPDPGIKPASFASQVDSLPAEPPGKPKKLTNGSKNGLSCISFMCVSVLEEEGILERFPSK